MKLATPLAVALLALTLSSTTLAQEQGYWRPLSKTASASTGDIVISADKLTINFVSMPIAEIRVLTPAEISSVFDVAADSPITGHLYRLDIPASRIFMHKNHLCGADATQWMALRAEGKQLSLAFFSNPNPPVFTRDAISNSTDLCGTFTYTR